MLYVLEQGPTEQSLLEMCMRERRPLPAVIQNAPELLPGLELYYGAYLDLQSHRQLGLEEGPIPHLAVMDYADRYDFEEDQRDDLLFFVKKLDAKYFEWRREDKRRRSKSSTGKAQGTSDKPTRTRSKR